LKSKSQTGSPILRVIAVFKFLKAALLIAAGIGALHLVNKDVAQYADNVVSRFHLDPGNRYVGRALARVSDVTPRRLHEVGAVAFVYAALFLIEGVGLWSMKRWGEWVTVIITGSLLPFEVYELYRRASLTKAGVLVLNAVILLYLISRLRRGGSVQRAGKK
jgi:uncharacterized membrane protein (DUF2068 family)